MVWELPDGTPLSCWPVDPGLRVIPWYREVLAASVVPATSPLATVTAGEELLRRAWAMATVSWAAEFGKEPRTERIE